MLKIGEFARICQVNTQTLRFYDAEGVLQADVIDPKTGYRYYKTEKIKTFGKIKTLKQAGFSLEEIKILLDGTEEARSVLLAQKRTALTRERDRINDSLVLVERLGHRQEILGERSVQEAIALNFEDDPAVIGRWELMGQVRTHIQETWGTPKTPADTVHPTLICLPGGGMWWNILWSKGVIYGYYENRHCVRDRYALYRITGTRVGFRALKAAARGIVSDSPSVDRGVAYALYEGR